MLYRVSFAPPGYPRSIRPTARDAEFAGERGKGIMAFADGQPRVPFVIHGESCEGKSSEAEIEEAHLFARRMTGEIGRAYHLFGAPSERSRYCPSWIQDEQEQRALYLDPEEPSVVPWVYRVGRTGENGRAAVLDALRRQGASETAAEAAVSTAAVTANAVEPFADMFCSVGRDLYGAVSVYRRMEPGFVQVLLTLEALPAEERERLISQLAEPY